MHLQLVTFELLGITESAYLDVAGRLVGRFASLPGLRAKVWLGPSGSNSYAALYLWDDRQSMVDFLAGDLYEGTNPQFANVASHDFECMEDLTYLTQKGVNLLGPADLAASVAEVASPWAEPDVAPEGAVAAAPKTAAVATPEAVAAPSAKTAEPEPEPEPAGAKPSRRERRRAKAQAKAEAKAEAKQAKEKSKAAKAAEKAAAKAGKAAAKAKKKGSEKKRKDKKPDSAQALVG